MTAVSAPIRRQLATRWSRRDLRTGLLFISPWIIGFLGLTLYPMLSALYYSFTNYNLLQPPTFVGLQNYHAALHDPYFWKSLENTALYAVMTVIPGQIFALALALLLNTRVKGLAIFRAVYFLPLALPLVAVSVVWGSVFSPQYGYLNAILRDIGVSQPPGWLASPLWTKPAYAIMSLWFVGAAVVVYLAALQGVPSDLLEAAELDGAGTLRRFFHVTMAMISPAILFNVVLSAIQTFQFFTQPFVLQGTSGGPLQAGLFYSPYIWLNGFSNFKMGYASALAWILFLIIMVTTALVMRFMQRRVYYEEAP